MRYPFKILRRITRSLHFLMFLNGFLLASMFYFLMESTYENGLFASIKADVQTGLDANDNADSLFVKSMHESYHLMHNRLATFANGSLLGPENGLFHSTSVDLMTTNGACGSYSQVLARILRSFNYPVRIAQMKAKGRFGAHNVVEANDGKHWILLDPTFDLYFVRPDAQLASFADVHQDWPYYSRQVPADYDPSYRYEDVRYTNWTKIPILFPLLKKVLTLTIGAERTNGMSIRTIWMNSYSVWFYVFLVLEITLFVITCKRYVRFIIIPRRNDYSAAPNPTFAKYVPVQENDQSWVQ
ncbi:MAG TPA: hypothetical protein VHE54_15300 [Puia sp.]|nr:hypothetical protein [Puia sp.]